MCVEDQYHFGYRVIDEHVRRIENSSTVQRATHDDDSPTMSLRSARPHAAEAAPYWQRWVSPDELPCRDILPAPRRPRDPLSRDRALVGREPCVKKRKSHPVDAGEYKKRRREEKSPKVAAGKCHTDEGSRREEGRSRGRKKSSETDCKRMHPLSASPCNNLQSGKPPKSIPCKQSRAKYRKSPINDRTVLSRKPCHGGVMEASAGVFGKSQLSGGSRTLPNDCRPKLSSGNKTPCRNVDTTRADFDSSLSDVAGKFVSCKQQSLSPRTDVREERPYEQVIADLSHQGIDSGVVKPCTGLESSQTRPQPPHTMGKAFSVCAEKELSKTADGFDSPVDTPCRQHADMATSPTADEKRYKPGLHTSGKLHSGYGDKETDGFDSATEKPCRQRPRVDGKTHQPEKLSSDVEQLPGLSERKPCKHAESARKRSPETAGSRSPSRERKCKNKPPTDDLTTEQFSGLKDTKRSGYTPIISSTQTTKEAEAYKKCHQTPTATVLDTEKLPKSDAVPVEPEDQPSREKTSNKTNTSATLKPIIPQNMDDKARQSSRRCRRRANRNEDESRKKESAVMPTLTREQTVASKQRGCIQTSVMTTYDRPVTSEEVPETELKMPAEREKSSKMKSKPCKNTEHSTRTAQETATEAKEGLTDGAVHEKQPAEECPCSKTADMQSEKITAHELTGDRGTEKTAVKECSSKIHGPEVTKIEKPCRKKADVQADKTAAQEQSTDQKTVEESLMTESLKTEETATASKEKPCEKNAAIKSDSASRPEKLRKGEIIQKTNAESPGMIAYEKQKPCHQQKTEAVVRVPDDQPTKIRKPCEKKRDSVPQKQPVEKKGEELPKYTDEEEDNSQLKTWQYYDEIDELLAPCSSVLIDSHAPTPQCRQYQTSSEEPAPKEPHHSANEFFVRIMDQQVAVPNYGAKCRNLSDFFATSEVEEEEIEELQSSESISPRSERCGCPNAENSEAAQTIKEDIPTTPESKPEIRKCCKDKSGSSTEKQPVEKTDTELARFTDREEIINQLETDQYLDEIEELLAPCSSVVMNEINDNDMVTSTVQELNALVGPKCWHNSPVDDIRPSPAQNEVPVPDQKLGEITSPCRKSQMPSSDQSVVESTTRLIRRCRQERILKLFKFKKTLPCQFPDSSPSPQPSFEDQFSDQESEVSDRQLDGQSESYQNTSQTVVKQPHLSQNLSTLVGYDTNSSTEVEKLAESAELGVGPTATAESLQSVNMELEDTGTRKVQSDDLDVMKGRQNLSSEVLLHCSQPSMGVSDSYAPPANKGKTPRKDSGMQHSGGVSRPPAVPRTVAEDISTPLEWESSDDTDSEVTLQTNVPRKHPKRRRHALKDKSSSIVEAKQRKGPHRTKAARTRRISCRSKAEEDPHISDSGASTEGSDSDTAPNVSSHPPDQDADSKDNSNSSGRKASNKLDVSNWSDSSSDPNVVLPKPK